MWKSFKNKANIARQLSLSEWLHLAEAWWVLLGFSIALRCFSLERLKYSFHLSGRKQVHPSQSLNYASDLQGLVSLAARYHFLAMTCLIKACTLHWILGRSGVPSQLCIGVNQSLAGIQAHAWVEVMAQAIGEPEDMKERFKVLEPSQVLNPLCSPFWIRKKKIF